jgi:hypothetical protein
LKDIQAAKDKIMKASDGAYYIPDVFRDEILRMHGLIAVNEGDFPYKAPNFLLKLAGSTPVNARGIAPNGPC